MEAAAIEREIRRYIADEFLEGDDRDLEPSSPLLEWGIIDSVSMRALVSFLEGRFDVRLDNDAMVPENFRSLERISSLVIRYSARPPRADADEGEGADAELAELVEFGARRRWTSLDSGGRIHAIEMAGPPPTLVLLPEPGYAASALGDMQRALEGELRSLAVDLPGFGLSTGPSAEPSFWDHAGLLEEWLRTEPGPLLLAGHGLSALLAMELARRAPDRVRAVAALGFGVVPALSALQRADDGVEAFLEARHADRSALRAAAVSALERRMATPAFARFVDAELIAHRERLVAQTGVPVLFIGALQDRLVQPAEVDAAAASVPVATTKWLARTGHAFPIERADETVSLLLTYVRDLSGGDS